MELSSHLLRYLADASVRSLALVAVAGAAIALVRPRSAAVRHAVWMTAVCAMLALPLATLTLPEIPLRVLRADKPVPAVSAVPAPSAPTASASVTAPAPVRASSTWPQWAAALYLAGFATFLGRLMFGYAVSRRLLRKSAPARNARLGEAFTRLGLRPTDVIESASVAAPVTIGCIKPRIVLPVEWQDWDLAKLEAALV